MQKMKHAASKGTLQQAASGQYIEKNLVLSEKTNMRNHMQMTGVRDGAPGNDVGLTLRLNRMNELKRHVS
jgi:hypothetical protein